MTDPLKDLDDVTKNRIAKLFFKSCPKVHIDLKDFMKVFEIGHQAIQDGLNDEEVAKVIVEFVNSIKKNKAL